MTDNKTDPLLCKYSKILAGMGAKKPDQIMAPMSPYKVTIENIRGITGGMLWYCGDVRWCELKSTIADAKRAYCRRFTGVPNFGYVHPDILRRVCKTDFLIHGIRLHEAPNFSYGYVWLGYTKTPGYKLGIGDLESPISGSSIIDWTQDKYGLIYTTDTTAQICIQVPDGITKDRYLKLQKKLHEIAHWLQETE